MTLLRACNPGPSSRAGEGEGSETSSGTSPVVMPFVSGHFEYGLGRAAGKRTVFMFMRKAHLAGRPVWVL